MEFYYKISNNIFDLFGTKDSMIDDFDTVDVELVEEQVHVAFISPYIDGHIILAKDDTDLDYRIRHEIVLPKDIHESMVVGGLCLLLQRDNNLYIQRIAEYTVNDLSIGTPLGLGDAKKICVDSTLTPIHNGDKLRVIESIFLNEKKLLEENTEMIAHRVEGFYFDGNLLLRMADEVTGVELILPSLSILKL